MGNSGFVHFCLFFFILRIFGFFPFSRIYRSGCFWFCLDSRFGGQPFTPPNLPTSDLSILPPHTTAYLQPNHILPPHNRTLPSCTPDLTPEPAVDMSGASHTRTYTTRKTDKNALGYHGEGGKKDHTRSSASGGVGRHFASRPHVNKRPPTDHRTTLHSPLPPNHTLPTHPGTHLSHPPPHNHTLP